jgi:subtilase family serine protease
LDFKDCFFMRIRSLVSALAVLLFAGHLLIAQDRLPHEIALDAARTSMANSVSPRAKAATDLGPAPGELQLESLSLRFRMTAAQSAALTRLLADQQTPSSPRYHRWLTPEQFADQFGLSAADIASVCAWLQAHGLEVTGAARSRTFVSFSGTVDQVNQAFGLSLHTVSYQGEQHIANLTDPVLPAALADVVLSVNGLNDFRLKPRGVHRQLPAQPAFNGGSIYGNLIAPGDFYTIYDVKPLLASSIDGSGVKIAVLGQVAISNSDVSAFRSAAGLSTSNLPTTITYGRAPAAPTSNGSPSFDDLDESQLDVEWAGAVAPSATVLFVNGEDVFANALTGAIDNDIAPIITVSYGACEAENGNSFLTQYNMIFEQANAQGQTINGPAGDSGATDCESSTTYATHGLAVDFPASSPYVTGVGGTEFDEGGGTYWNSSDGANAGSALSYIPEQPWNEFFQASANGQIYGLQDGAGGGGASKFFAKPAWQIGSGVPADSARDVPDIAFSAAANHDGYLICTQGSCTNGFADSRGDYTVIGGTSVSTPSFAGVLALLEQKIQAKVGNANPVLYGLANSSYFSTVFHDVTSGTNAAPCQVGATGCEPGDAGYHAPNTLACPANSCSGTIAYSTIGYTAGAGYDLTTGWGSIDVANLVADWLLVLPAGTTPTNIASTTTVSASSTQLTIGTAVTISVTVASGSSAVTSTPTGTVQLLVDGADSGSAVTLAGGAASFPAYSTTSLAAGAHVFSVQYSGDGKFASSSGSVTVNVSAAATGDFSLSPTTASVTAISGSSAPGITFTVGSLNGFAGNVNFTIGSISPLVPLSQSFSINPVTVTANTAGTTVLTLTAAAPASASAVKGRLAAAQVPWRLGGAGVAVAGLLLLVMPGRRRRWPGLLVLLLSVSVLAAGGCGGNSTTASSTPVSGTPAGTYTLLVGATGTNASGASVSHNATVTLTVQ